MVSRAEKGQRPEGNNNQSYESCSDDVGAKPQADELFKVPWPPEITLPVRHEVLQ